MRTLWIIWIVWAVGVLFGIYLVMPRILRAFDRRLWMALCWVLLSAVAGFGLLVGLVLLFGYGLASLGDGAD